MTDPTPAPAAAPQPATPLSESDDKLWASLAHFGGILWLLPSLIIWLVLKDRGARVNVEAKEALNWQITWIGAWIIAAILSAVTIFFGIGLLFILIQWLLYLANLIFSILGGVKVQQGGSYRYPVAVRFVK